MKYGMCIMDSQLEFIKDVAEQGYDYIELRFGMFGNNDTEKINEVKSLMEKNNIGCEACNCFLPGTLKVTGDSIDEAALSSYIETGMKNLSEIGCKIVVFGSGGSRNVPEGYDEGKAFEQIAHFLKTIAGPIAGKYGITIVIEPLRNPDSNIIHTVADAVKLAKLADHPAVSSLGDLYHMYAMDEEPESIADFDGLVKHCHIATPVSRAFPKLEDDYDFTRFFNVMEKIGCERCSVEGSTQDFANDSAEAIKVFKAWAK